MPRADVPRPRRSDPVAHPARAPGPPPPRCPPWKRPRRSSASSRGRRRRCSPAAGRSAARARRRGSSDARVNAARRGVERDPGGLLGFLAARSLTSSPSRRPCAASTSDAAPRRRSRTREALAFAPDDPVGEEPDPEHDQRAEDRRLHHQRVELTTERHGGPEREGVVHPGCIGGFRREAEDGGPTRTRPRPPSRRSPCTGSRSRRS